MVERQQIEATTRNVFSYLSKAKFSELPNLLADDFTYRSSSGADIQGYKKFRRFWSQFTEAFADLELEIQQLFPREDINQLAVLYRQTGTHVGQFQGIEPSEKELNLLQCAILTFDDDAKLLDLYDVVDVLAMYDQLDALPESVSRIDFSGTRPAPGT